MVIRVYAETLVLYGVILIFVVWFIWLRITHSILKRRYKPEDDRSRKGEEYRRDLARRESSSPKRPPQPTSSNEPSRHIDLPIPKVKSTTKNRGSPGETSPGPRRKPRTGIRGLFRRRG